MSKHNPFMQFIALSLYLHRKLIFGLAIGFGLLFLFTANMGPSFSPIYSFSLFIGGALISNGAFKEVHDKGSNVQYLTLPISALNRYIAVWVMTGPLYLFFITVLYGIGILAHIFAKTFWDFGSIEVVIKIAGAYLVVNALFLFGSITFKRLALVKTLLGLLGVGVILIILKNLAEEVGLSHYTAEAGHYGFWAILGVIAWVSAYQKLKKSELR